MSKRHCVVWDLCSHVDKAYRSHWATGLVAMRYLLLISSHRLHNHQRNREREIWSSFLEYFYCIKGDAHPNKRHLSKDIQYNFSTSSFGDTYGYCCFFYPGSRFFFVSPKKKKKTQLNKPWPNRIHWSCSNACWFICLKHHMHCYL